jgi:uncharacterized protein YggT (Ycf19 family)
MDSTLAYWVFHLPNFMLAALIYTLIGRYIMSLFIRPQSDMVIWVVFRQITDPILRIVQMITPAVVPPPLVNLFAIIWLIILRFVFFYIMRLYGPLPATT